MAVCGFIILRLPGVGEGKKEWAQARIEDSIEVV
jgi:hypothetical protein